MWITVVLLLGGSIDGVVLLIAVDLIIAATLAVEHSRIERSGASEDQAAGRHAGAGGHEHVLDVVDLVARGPAQLAHALGDAVHPVDVRLAEQAAARVDRQLATEREALDGGEVLGLARAAEPEVLELHEHEGREVVVEEGGRDVLGPQAGLLPELVADDAASRAGR